MRCVAAAISAFLFTACGVASERPQQPEGPVEPRTADQCSEKFPFRVTYLPPRFAPEPVEGPAPGGRRLEPGQIAIHYTDGEGSAIEFRRPGTAFVELALADDAPTITILGGETANFGPISPDGSQHFIVQFSHPRAGDHDCGLFSLNGYGVSPEEVIRVAEALETGEDDGSESEGDHGAPTRRDRRVVKALIEFANVRDEETMAEVPVAQNGLWLGLADRLMVRHSAQELADAKVWRLRAKLFRAYVGQFSALDLLAGSGPTVISLGSHPHCASPPVPPPANVADFRRVSVQPKDTESCLQWFTVDLFLDPGWMIAAVTLDVWEP